MLFLKFIKKNLYAKSERNLDSEIRENLNKGLSKRIILRGPVLKNRKRLKNFINLKSRIHELYTIDIIYLCVNLRKNEVYHLGINFGISTKSMSSIIIV